MLLRTERKNKIKKTYTSGLMQSAAVRMYRLLITEPLQICLKSSPEIFCTMYFAFLFPIWNNIFVTKIISPQNLIYPVI